MLEQIIGSLIHLISSSISQYRYLAIIILMALESANIPIPSEIILPYSGFLVSSGSMNFHLAALAGGFGCLVGSIISYYLGLKLGRPFLWKYGKWLLISRQDILWSEKFLKKFGDLTFFITRLLPVFRTFISFVIGIAKGDFLKFSIYTFVGSWIWSYLLIYLGIMLGDHWEILRDWWHKFDIAIALIILFGIAFHIYRVFRHSRQLEEVEIKNE
jgi:membrane protein DedA with SNARE-associated domain